MSHRRIVIGSTALVAFAAALLIVLLGVWQSIRSRDATLAAAEENARNLTRSLAQHAARTIESVDLMLADIKERVEHGQDMREVVDVIRRQNNFLDQVSSITILDASRNRVADAVDPNGLIPRSDHDDFDWHRDHIDPSIHLGSVTAGSPLVIPLSRRIDKADGSFAGVVVANLAPNYFQSFYRTIKIGEQGTAALWSDTGEMLVRFPVLVGGQHLPVSPSLADDARQARSGISQSISPWDGVERIFAFDHVDRYHLLVSSAISVNEALAGWRRQTLVESAVLGFAAACLFAVGVAAERNQRRARAIEAASQESHRLYRLLADSSSDMVQCLGLDGTRRYVSPAAMEILGYDAAALIGTHSVQLVHPDEAERLDDIIDQLFKGTTEQARSTHRLRHQAGNWIWVESRLRLIRGADGSPLEIVSNLRDVTERELLTRQLQLTNRQLRAAEELAGIGHWRVALKDRGISWSDGMFAIHGLPPGSSAPTLEAAIDAYHADDRPKISEQFARVIATREGYVSRVRLIRANGEVRHVVSRGFCEIDDDTGEVQAVFGAMLDVTELTETERRLATQSTLLETALNSMDQGLIKVAENGTVELANPRFLELLRLPPQLIEQAPLHFADIIGRRRKTNGEDTAGCNIPLTAPGVQEHQRPDGTVLEIRTVQLPDGAIVSTYADITARRSAESALRASEARYRTLANSTSDVITQLDLDLVRRYVSPGCRAMLGYEPEEMLGTTPSSLIHPNDAREVRQTMEFLLSGKVQGDRTMIVNRMRHKQGHWIWLEAVINLVRDPATGLAQSLICSLRDITERQRAARHLEQARATAERAALAKAEFLANMSHELRTPLTGILGLHDLLRKDPTLNAQQAGYLAMAYEAGRSLMAIVNDILDFSKIEAGQLTIEDAPLDLRGIVTACCDLEHGEAAKKVLKIDVQLATGPWIMMGDATRLRQIILNLLTNAIKFTERGSVLITASYSHDRSRFRIAVSDTGIGIPEEKLSVLFQRFSQADSSVTRQFGGTGLGLAICKKLVELMGGEIGVVSEPGRGSTFWFELPLRLTTVPAPLDDQAAGTVLRFTPRRILLAEDNLINQTVITEILKQRGHHVTVVDNGVAAVSAFGASPFDVVLMDVQMPMLDGYSATRAIRRDESRENRSSTPIIGLTANATKQDREDCEKAGMDAHVGKPIDWGTLFATIEAVTNRSQLPAAAEPAPTVTILDETTLNHLAEVLGRDPLAQMLKTFMTDLRQRIAHLDAMTEIEILDYAHTCVSMAGHFGLIELSQLCVDIETELKTGEGSERIAKLQAVGERAMAAAQSSGYAVAA
ncbi:PAS domain S-box protein [Lichenifustis flavocetrariae]|uniref:histidine kinase n=1 Tax=Lichenifustis flavocetrariae TaxID=2949735 RepID=A0AA41Z3G8_9HYPH|nr:PAS domain S-box protein [Lichenifustis flavocetrariae]MCW6513029.1 PAS domain S-box protein [Lichenifustis flavocetrariae]